MAAVLHLPIKSGAESNNLRRRPPVPRRGNHQLLALQQQIRALGQAQFRDAYVKEVVVVFGFLLAFAHDVLMKEAPRVHLRTGKDDAPHGYARTRGRIRN